MNKRVTLYTTLISLIGLFIVLGAIGNLPEDRLSLLLFTILTFSLELASVELFTTARGSRVSVSTIITVAALLVLGTSAGVITHVAAGIANLFSERIQTPEEVSKQRAVWWQRMAFNAGMLAISAALAGYTYQVTSQAVVSVTAWSSFLPFVSTVLVLELSNILMLVGVLTIQTQRNPWQILKMNFLWGLPIALLGDFLGGGMLALASQMFGLLGVMVFFIPILLINYSYRLYLRNTRQYVNQLEQANRKLEEVNLDLLGTLGAVIDAYDLYTYGHSNQVAIYARSLARILKRTPKEQETIFRAGLVHDMGKVGVNEALISKQGPLTDEEYEMIKRHSNIGADIIAQMDGLQELVPLVRHHHERWDGRGYPDGLAREEIPIGSRILSLADALDTMCSDRPFRPTMSFPEVLAEVRRCSGTQFDPQVVEAFFQLVDQKGWEFFKNSADMVDRSVFADEIPGVRQKLRYIKKSFLKNASPPG